MGAVLHAVIRGSVPSHSVALPSSEWKFEVLWCDPTVSERREKEKKTRSWLAGSVLLMFHGWGQSCAPPRYTRAMKGSLAVGLEKRHTPSEHLIHLRFCERGKKTSVWVKVKVLAAQSCLILCNPLNCSPPACPSMGFSVCLSESYSDANLGGRAEGRDPRDGEGSGCYWA